MDTVAIHVAVPARVGDVEDAIETPALIVDLDAFDENIRLASALLAPHPHVRNTRCWATIWSHRCCVISSRTHCREPHIPVFSNNIYESNALYRPSMRADGDALSRRTAVV